MSLINNMLRDLEAQKQEKRDVPQQEPELTPVKRVTTHRRTVLIGGSALVILAVVIGLLLKLSLLTPENPAQQSALKEQPAAHGPASLELVTPVVLPQPMVPAPLPASLAGEEKNDDLKLSALIVTEEATQARIRLAFERMPDYRLLQNGSATEPLIVSFKAVRLDPDFELPELPGEIIDNVSLRPKRADLQLVIDSKSQTRISALQIEEKPDHSFDFWVELDVVNSNNSSVAVNTAPVQTPVTAPPVVVQPDKPSAVEREPEVEVEKVNKKPEVIAPEKQAYIAAMEFLQQQDLIQAQSSFERALELNPHMFDARMQLVELFLSAQNFVAAEDSLRQGVQLAPTNMTVRKQLVRLLLQLQRSAEALRLLARDPLPTVAEDQEYHALYAAALQEQRRYEEAGQLYRQLVSLRPQQAVWWMGLAISMDQAGFSEQARGAYEQAVALPGLRPDLQDYIRGRLQVL